MKYPIIREIFKKDYREKTHIGGHSIVDNGNVIVSYRTGAAAAHNVTRVGPAQVNFAVGPIGSTAITGFSLTVNATNEYSAFSQLVGKAYASDYASPTPSKLITAVSNMEAAYTDAAGRAADYTELYMGDLSGRTLTPGVYKWGTGVLINSNVTLNGGANDVWIFQVAKGITQASGTQIILSQTNITLGTNALINGRLLAQTAVTLIKSTVVAP